MRRFLMLLALASLFFIATLAPAQAQTAIAVTNPTFKLDYPNTMTFHANASSSSPITTLEVLVRFPASNVITRVKANLTPSPQVDATAVWDLRGATTSAVGGYLPPGASGVYSWHVQDQAGNQFDSSPQPFRIDDTRETWKKLENAKFVLYWYDGGQDFGQAIFDKANQTLTSIQADIGATIGTQIQIFIYGNRQEFLTALAPGNQEWAGGTIDETFNVVLINADSSSLDYALEAMPHELTHLVTHAAVKGPYSGLALPLWMDEGLAVYHEYTPPKDARFAASLQRAIQTDSLFRLRTISERFPSDPTQADLAYGESFSVVAFMIKTYGRDKMKQILDLFKQGTTPDDAFQQVLGVDEDGLENAWRQSVGAQLKNYPKAPTPTPGAVPTFAFSSAETPGAAQATPTTVALQQTPAPNNTPTSASGGGGGGAGGLCGGLFGAVGLLAFGAWRLAKRR
jgi:Peptidase MA superfamily